MLAFFILILIFFKVFNFRKVFANFTRVIIFTFSYLDKEFRTWFISRNNIPSLKYPKFFFIYEYSFFFEFAYFCPMIYYFYYFFFFISHTKYLLLHDVYRFFFRRVIVKSTYNIKYYFFYNFSNKKLIII